MLKCPGRLIPGGVNIRGITVNNTQSPISCLLSKQSPRFSKRVRLSSAVVLHVYAPTAPSSVSFAGETIAVPDADAGATRRLLRRSSYYIIMSDPQAGKPNGPSRESGGNGRRAGLRSRWPRPCGFESRLSQIYFKQIIWLR
jgi:hypothetical protein